MSRTPASIRHAHRPASRHASRGFTLIELMIAITLGLFILIGLVSLLVSSVISRSELDKSSRQIESGRYAIQLLSEDLQHAGYVGASGSTAFAVAAPITACPAAITDLSYVAQTTGTSTVPLPLYSLAAMPASCNGISNNVKANTAMIVVSRVNTNPIATAAKVATETYLQLSSCDITPTPPPFAVDTGAATFTLLQKDCATPEVLRKVVQHVYFVSTCNICTGSGADTTPTLKMAEYVNGATIITPLVEGIENLQFDYGIDMDGDGAPDCYTSNPASPPAAEIAACKTALPSYVWTDATTNWSNVMAARVHVLARNTEASAGWSDARKYDLGLAIGQFTPPTIDKAFKRHVYSAVVRLYNSSGQREQP